MKVHQLCMALVHANTPDEVIALLEDADYWDDDAVWRDLGDNENNYSILGAQQSDPIAALVEKLVNSVDARLMNECMVAKVKPDSKQAPGSVREAVAQLIEHSDPTKATNGRIENWTATERRDQAKRITLAATGPKTAPCLSISDEGEGQTPGMVPHTFMSLAKANKLRIPFVQGKFNMGGTGALRFCGGFHHLQLIVTRRTRLSRPPRTVTSGASRLSVAWSRLAASAVRSIAISRPCRSKARRSGKSFASRSQRYRSARRGITRMRSRRPTARS